VQFYFVVFWVTSECKLGT